MKINPAFFFALWFSIFAASSCGLLTDAVTSLLFDTDTGMFFGIVAFLLAGGIAFLTISLCNMASQADRDLRLK